MSHSIKYRGKLFIADGEQIVLGKFIEGLLCMEGKWLDQLPIMKGYIFDDKALASQQNCGSIYS